MSNLFNPDNRFFTFMSKAFDILVINIVFLLTFAPFIGFMVLGANLLNREASGVLVVAVFILAVVSLIVFIPSLTALYYSVVKAIRHSRSYPTTEFIRSFKQNFRTGSKASVIYIVLAGFLAYDYPYAVELIKAGENKGTFMLGLFIMVTFCALSTLIFLCPILSRFNVTLGNAIRFSFGLSLKHIWVTLLSIPMWLVILFFGYATAGLVLFFGISTGMLIESFMIEKVLKKYMQQSIEAQKANNPAVEGEEETKTDEWYLE